MQICSCTSKWPSAEHLLHIRQSARFHFCRRKSSCPPRGVGVPTSELANSVLVISDALARWLGLSGEVGAAQGTDQTVGGTLYAHGPAVGLGMIDPITQQPGGSEAMVASYGGLRGILHNGYGHHLGSGVHAFSELKVSTRPCAVDLLACCSLLFERLIQHHC